ncbi:EcsC family protein [Maribacter sp. 1_MG-2023]|uniref:EcsC family protein n=1 Tax=Maribacter sp. 1_MG-2023 TaxID=3062677 RepID=UPI0026E13977|nr:EcsC family protein [Maribacter sp. 1_MG-2023]MDO6470938.1 EcsC family protein [Maribacter sp. 1_MG-2023]
MLVKNALSREDLETIKKCKASMENIGWAIKGVNVIGNSLETGARFIPEKALNILQKSTEKILLGLLKANLLTISKNKQLKEPSSITYKAIVIGSGTVGGFFGSTTGIGTAIFASEMTITTKYILRSIMDIARSQGEDIYSLEGQMQCMEVFALGGKSKDDDSIDTSYYVARAALSSTLKNLTSASLQAAIKTAANSSVVFGSNAMNKFITQIAARFSVLISEKFMAQAVPIAGALGGGSMNFIFINHFQKMATSHFTLRRLERKYGEDAVMKAYSKI